ncbi:AAA family ATPase [Candidatus Woesearchaeota archaeon]|nr:MAG: AAA family ATPase [Candidatus Woesearchaeota archaeon]
MANRKVPFPQEFYDKLTSREEIFPRIIGQKRVKEELRSALLAGRHVILVGPPGIGKTTLAKSVAEILPAEELNDCHYHCRPEKPICPECLAGKHKPKPTPGEERFIRVQGSPDLTAEDLLGDIDPIKALKMGPLSPEAFTPGKIFKANNGILFFDEINRCPAKLQNALLQVLEERKATIASYDVDFPAEFILIGTMNPEDNSTEPLSDVFIDRFDIIRMGYPETLEEEKEIVKQNSEAICEFPEELLEFTIAFVRNLRENKELEKHPGVRASIGLYERAQANARIRGGDRVLFEDVRKAVASVLSHRIRLAPTLKYLRSPEEFIRNKFEEHSENNSEILEKFGDGP